MSSEAPHSGDAGGCRIARSLIAPLRGWQGGGSPGEPDSGDDPAQTTDSKSMVVPEDLVNAYRRTEFRVADRGWSFVLRIDERSSVLASCHEAFGVTRSAYLTAWNPRSEPTALEINQSAQRALEAELTSAGLSWLRGEGVDPSGHWPGEPSVLVLGISTDDAIRFCREYGQNAIVVAGRDAVPRLAMVHGKTAAGV